MHHFIYPEKDTFITNTLGYDNKNFGLDEILCVGTKVSTIKSTSPTTTIQISQSTSSICVSGFSGSITDASIYGTASVAIGTISSSASTLETTNFSGQVTGSSFTNFSGSISGSFSGSISGKLLTPYVDYFNGIVSDFTGKLISGNINGVDVLQKQNVTIYDNISINRTLVQFNLTSISKSINNGDITNPKFILKLNVAREENLPIQYYIYAYPILESWEMGNGYVSDNGSSDGTNWNYRDALNHVTWSVSGSTYGTTPAASQSFDYQVGDISMDVTNVVNNWLYNGLQNNGIVLISGDELSTSGSGMGLYFFSKDTNTIYEPTLDVSWGDDYSWSTGSLITSSANISSIDTGLSGQVFDNSSISGSLYGGFTGFANISISSSLSYSFDTSSNLTSSFFYENASGLMSVTGVNGLIISMSIIGNFSGSISSSINTINQVCQQCIPQFDAGFNYPGQGQNQTQYEGQDIYGWGHSFNEFNQYDWTSDHVYQQEFGPGFSGSNCGPYQVTASFLMGTLIDGLFSGSTFTSSLINGYILGYGNLVGSWNSTMINGTYINSNYPFKPLYPNALFVNFSGSYVNGQALGTITNTSSSYGLFNYGIFSGVFTSGPIVGMQIYAPFTGSILSSSYFYTSSLNIISSSLSPINTQSPFTTVIQNLPSSVKSGDIIKVNVFARQEFQLKNFNRQTQFTQYITPQYLPSGSSYYAIKDNITEEMILDFDENTAISCDKNGNYFLLDTTGYPQERYFRILIKTTDGSQSYTFDKGNTFKIIR